MNKMGSIVIRSLKDRRTSALVFILAAMLIAWMYVAIFPILQQDAGSFEQVLEAFPEEMDAAFGLDEAGFGFDSLERFLAMEQFSLIIPLMMIFLVAGIAGWALAGEIEHGTIEHLLAKPVPRWKIYAGRYAAGFIIMAGFAAAASYSPIFIAQIMGIDYVAFNYSIIAIMVVLFGWAILSVSMFLSSLFSEKSKTSMTIGALMIVMYLGNIAAQLVEKMEWLQYVSFFHYYDHNSAIVNATIGWESWVFFGAVIILFSVAGGFWFQRRDIAV